MTLSFSQIYLSWKSGPAEVKHWKDMMGRPRTAVSQWHALKAWGTQWPPCLQCSYPQNSTTCGLVLQIMCVISLFSGLFDILCPQSFSDTIFKFHPCQVLIPTLPPLISLSELKNVFDVFTHFLLMPLWELVVFFSSYPSVFPPHTQCLTSGKYPLPPITQTTNQKWMKLTF